MSHPMAPLPADLAPVSASDLACLMAPLAPLHHAGIQPLGSVLAGLTAEQAVDPAAVVGCTRAYVQRLVHLMLHDDDNLSTLTTAFTADLAGLPCLWRRLVMLHLDMLIWHACLEEFQNWRAAGLGEVFDWACAAGLVDPQHEPLFVRWVASTLWSRMDPVSDKPAGHAASDARVALAVAVCAFSALENPDAAFDRYLDMATEFFQDRFPESA